MPADEQFTHPESGICRDLFDCGEVPVTAEGHHCRVIVATHAATTLKAPIGVTRDGVVSELFFSALPALGFTAADVVKLYLHRGSFETVLADEDREQDSDRWSSYTPHGKAGLADPLPMGVEPAKSDSVNNGNRPRCVSPPFPPSQTEAPPSPNPSVTGSSFGPPHWAHAARRGSLGGHDFLLQPDGTLRCQQGATLYPQERRPEHDGTVRVLYAARIADCRCCPIRIHCQGHGTATKKPRRVSAVLHPLPKRASEEPPPSCLSTPAPHPILWGDWSRCQPRRAWIEWQRSHLVTVQVPSISPPLSTPSLLSRAKPGALASGVAATIRTQCPATYGLTYRDDHLWALT